MDAAAVGALLSSEAAEERARAYACLEGTAADDVPLAAACVAPLCALLGRGGDGVGPEEASRAALALARLVALDGAQVGGEWARGGRWLAAWRSETNRLAAIGRKPVAELTQADALALAAGEAALGAWAFTESWDARGAAAGITGGEMYGAIWLSEPYGVGSRSGSEERNRKLTTLALAALREERDQMSEELLAGLWTLLTRLGGARPSVNTHQIESGMIGLAVAELRTMAPRDWVSVSRCRSGRAACAITAVGCALMSSNADAGDPGLLEVCIEALAAYQEVGSSDDTNPIFLFMVMLAMYNYCRRDGKQEKYRASIRAAGPSLRFLLDHPKNWIEVWASTTSVITGFFVADAFGRDEDDTGLQLSQSDIDSHIFLMLGHLSGEMSDGLLPLMPNWSDPPLHFCVSDRHKTLVLNNPEALTLLVHGLFVDPDHPRGDRASEILGELALPTPHEIQAVFQRQYVEALQQLTLLPVGREALLNDPRVIAALEAVAERGMTPEAKEHAAGALISLKGFADGEDSGVVAEHVMLSYQWSNQRMIVKINDALRRRKYLLR